MKVIAISGRAMNGKDTLAQMMSEVFQRDGKTVQITHFADLLKYICKTYFGWDGNKDNAGRELLQRIGTDVIRKNDENLWVNYMVSLLRCVFNEMYDVVIIPDARFPNEISVLRDNGFDVTHIRITRVGFVAPMRDEQANHISETAMDGVIPDLGVINGGTLDDLKKVAESAVEFVMGVNAT